MEIDQSMLVEKEGVPMSVDDRESYGVSEQESEFPKEKKPKAAPKEKKPKGAPKEKKPKAAPKEKMPKTAPSEEKATDSFRDIASLSPKEHDLCDPVQKKAAVDFWKIHGYVLVMPFKSKEERRVFCEACVTEVWNNIIESA